MADRRSLISRFWPPSGTRRSTPTQTTAPPPATPDTAPPSSPSRRPTTTTRTATPASAPPPSPSRRPTTTTRTATPASAPPPSPSRRPTTTTQPANPTTAPPSSPSRRPKTTTQPATPASAPPSIPNRRPTTTTQPAAEQPSSTSSEPRKSPSSQTQPVTSTNPKDEPKTSPSSTNPKDEPKTTSPSSTNPKDDPKTTSPSSTNPIEDPKTSPSSTNPIDDPKTSPSSTNPIDDPKTTSPSSKNLIDEPKTTSPSSKNPIDEPKTTSPSSINPIDAPKTSSPSREATQSSSPSKPASPNHQLAKSRSPPQPSYPAPQAQNIGSRASHPHLKSSSPKVGPSSSPKRTQPKSPSRESRQPGQDILSYEKDPKPAASQQEPQLNADVETDSANDFNGKTLDRTSFKHDEVGPTPYPSSEIDTSKPKEAEDVKEVVQATNTEANEETKKKNSGYEDQIIEKTEILSKPDRVQREETSGVTPGNTRNSQSKIKSTISSTHNKSAQSNGKHTPVHKQVAGGDPKGDISDKHVSMITLAGENRGALMQVQSNSSKQEGAVHIHRSYKINPDESPEATTDGEGSSDQKKTEDANSRDDQPTETYVNNNAQGINNSIVFNSSITEGSPGVHMVVTHLPKEPIQSTNNAETRKAEFNTTRTEKLTYQPTVRRRCLKGLFLETSDSDPENPEKPRRHGCRVGCEKRDKEDNVDVL